MKKLLSLFLATVLVLSSFSLFVFAAGEDNATAAPTPIFYENFDDAKVEDYTGDLNDSGIGSVVLKNNSPDKLKVDITGETNKAFHFETRNKNKESQTLFKLYELPETVTDYAVFMRVSFDSADTNWSGSATSRVGLAYGIQDGANYSYQDLRYAGGNKSLNLRKQINETGTSDSISDTVGGTANEYSMEVAFDTVYEMGIVVSGGKIYSYFNGKLIRANADATATSIDYAAAGRGIGIYGAYVTAFVDEFRVYDSAYLPAGYDALTATAYAEDASKAPLPTLDANLGSAPEPPVTPVPVFYQDFTYSDSTDFTNPAVLIKNNSPANLKVNIAGDANKSFHFETRNKNKESQAMFKLFELPEGVTDYAVFMTVKLDSADTNWSTAGTSRIGLAYGITDGTDYSYQGLHYMAEGKSLNLFKQINETEASGDNSIVSDTTGFTENGYTMDIVLDTAYEMAIIVSEGKIYSYLNGKLIRANADATATSIDYTATGRGVGIYGAYVTAFVDDFRVYDCAFVPADYDALNAAAYADDASKAALPTLPDNLPATQPKPEDEEPAPAAGTIIYEQRFDAATIEELNMEVVLNKGDDLTMALENGKLHVAAPNGTGSQVILKFGDMPSNVKLYTIVMKMSFVTLADMLDAASEKSVMGPAYSIVDGKNFSHLALRANGTYNFTRYLSGSWVSNKTNPEGGSSRNDKYYSVAATTEYELAMVVYEKEDGTAYIRSYINGILQPDDVPLHRDAAGFGLFFRYGDFLVDDYVIYAGQYLPEGYQALDSEPSYDDDLFVEDDNNGGNGDTVTGEVTGETTGEVTPTPTQDNTVTTATPNVTDPTTPGTTGTPAAEEDGCASAISGMLAILLLTGTAATVVCKKKSK